MVAVKSPPKLLNALAQIVGAKYLIAGDADGGDGARLQRYTDELRGQYKSVCMAVVLPADVAQVVAVVECCARAKISIVPQGGNTGTVGGAVARANQVILNLGRMNRVLEVDPINQIMRVQSGCILADVQQSALDNDRFFPLSLGAQGSCQIGGNLATNAGGINVLQYGNTRDLVLGLEVVLADGRIWNGMNSLRKNNTGYDLKNLFIGSEGTLGIITAATLKLFPLPRTRVVALVGLKYPDAALVLLNAVREASGDRLTTFELMAGIAVQSAIKHIHNQTNPLSKPHPWYVLLVADNTNDTSPLREQVENCLAQALQDKILTDAVIAENETQAQKLIRLRENIVEAQKFAGGSVKHDISVPVAAVAEFIRRATTAITQNFPTTRPNPYGHMGDGNMHFNITTPANMSAQDFQTTAKKITHLIHEITHDLNGSFSAEHGIGISKLAEMKRYKDPVSLDLYRQIKRALDPDDLFNPGKVNP